MTCKHEFRTLSDLDWSRKAGYKAKIEDWIIVMVGDYIDGWTYKRCE